MATTPTPAGPHDGSTAPAPPIPRTTPGSVQRSPAPVAPAAPPPTTPRSTGPARSPVPSTAAELPLTDIWLG